MCFERKNMQSRIAVPYVGYAGIAPQIWNVIVVIWMYLRLIEVDGTGAHVLIGLLLVTIVINLILWVIIVSYLSPNYKRIKELSSTRNDCNGLITIDKHCPDYQESLAMDLKIHNDQYVTQFLFLTGALTLMAIGFFYLSVGDGSIQRFYPLSPFPATDYEQFRGYILNKIFITIIILVHGWAFFSILETKSDFLWRHLAQINNQHYAEHKESLALGKNGAKSYDDGGLLMGSTIRR
jgi:small-conductance mechanosensitive channel